jgi:hypothetical protein
MKSYTPAGTFVSGRACGLNAVVEWPRWLYTTDGPGMANVKRYQRMRHGLEHRCPRSSRY